MNANKQRTSARDCPLCANKLERTEVHHGYFRSYVCPNCGLKWQSCVDPKEKTYSNVAQGWMRHLSQD